VPINALVPIEGTPLGDRRSRRSHAMVGIYSDLMGFYSDSMGFYSDSIGILMELTYIISY